jgi:hypothetical protein
MDGCPPRSTRRGRTSVARSLPCQLAIRRGKLPPTEEAACRLAATSDFRIQPARPPRGLRPARAGDTACTLRSFTGHSGTLFGSERTYGYSHYGSLFDTADDAVFDYVILGQLRNASRLVIARPWAEPTDLCGLVPVADPNGPTRSRQAPAGQHDQARRGPEDSSSH